MQDIKCTLPHLLIRCCRLKWWWWFENILTTIEGCISFLFRLDGDDVYVDAQFLHCVSLIWIWCYLYTARLQVRMVLGDHGMFWGWLVLGDTVLVHDAVCSEHPQMRNATLKGARYRYRNRCWQFS